MDGLSDLYSSGTLTGISPAFGCGGADVFAQAINDSGQITGGAGANAFSCNDGAFIYDATTKATTDLGIQGIGNAINASGEVTGTTSSAVAFLYSDGKVTLLPATVPEDTACQGSAINASGFIVGTCSEFVGYGPCPPNINCGVGNPPYYPEYIYHPFVYNGTTRSLNELVRTSDPLKPYVTLTDARGINDSGLIIVNGVDSRDKSNHAYLMQMAGLVGNAPPPSKSGGGAFDLLSLSFLIGMLALHRSRRKIRLSQLRHSKCV